MVRLSCRCPFSLLSLKNSPFYGRFLIPLSQHIASLTPFGESIIPVLEAMCNWGNSYLEGTATCVNSCSSI
ncbi:hypothetical protein DWZ96_12185 [Clostridium sp. AF36-18BH]|nr:hypothetical protein DWZ96_12185 [Clostridium sp. AF36-18BH]RHV51199.1 hypothetical protein DXB46_04805 [Lachnospiraceae bacterium OM04-12BH]